MSTNENGAWVKLSERDARRMVHILNAGLPPAYRVADVEVGRIPWQERVALIEKIQRALDRCCASHTGFSCTAEEFIEQIQAAADRGDAPEYMPGMLRNALEAVKQRESEASE